MSECVVTEFLKPNKEARRYIFFGKKMIRKFRYQFMLERYGFKNLPIDKPYDYVVESTVEGMAIVSYDRYKDKVKLFEETTDYNYKKDEIISIKGIEVIIERIVREPETGIYHVMTSYVEEVEVNTASREVAEKKKEKHVVDFRKRLEAERDVRKEERKAREERKAEREAKTIIEKHTESSEEIPDWTKALIGGLFGVTVILSCWLIFY